MEVKTIYVNYDIRRMRPPNLIAFTHENDKNTQVIELHLTDGDEPMTLNTDYTYTAAIVNSDTKALINDSIDCELKRGRQEKLYSTIRNLLSLCRFYRNSEESGR